MPALGQMVVTRSSNDDVYRAHDMDYSDIKFCIYVITENGNFNVHAIEYL
jgi:hypothetical protein